MLENIMDFGPQIPTAANAMNIATSVNFSVHPAILESVVNSQSGTLHKALLELIMNSCDAKATKIEVSIDSHSFKVKDDGEGFASKEQILTCFGQFGTPQSSQKTYGRFRIGRGQCFSWGVISWRTGPYRLVVDILNKGLQFDFYENEEPVNGCEVSGVFYEPIIHSDLYNAISNFKNCVLYVSTPIILAGQQINIVPSENTWDHENDDAYILVDKFRYHGLHVYNMGVHCICFPTKTYGVSGVVVTKKPLTVNFARNDIILNKCDVWKRVSRFIKSKGTSKLLKLKVLNDDEQVYVISRLLSGEFSFNEVSECPIFTDVSGKRFSITTLLTEKTISVSQRNKSFLADKVQSSRMARVLAYESLQRFGCGSLEELFSVLEELSSEDEYISELLSQVAIVEDVELFSSYFDGGYFVFDDKKLTQLENAAIQAIRYGERFVRRSLQESDAIEFLPLQRNILAGVSDEAEAWTDGFSNIFISRKWLKKAKLGIEWFQHVCQLLAHEYLHDESDQDSHPHDAIFYNAFHQVALYAAREQNGVDLKVAARKMAAKFVYIQKKAGNAVPKAFYQFGGVCELVHKRVTSDYYQVLSELNKLKRNSPYVDDPERLVFWRGEYGGVKTKGVMSLEGPLLYVGDKMASWTSDIDEMKYGSGHITEAQIVWEIGNVSLNNLSEIERKCLAEDIGCNIRPWGGRDIKPLCVNFYGSAVCRTHIREWIEREPALASLCKESPTSMSEWYEAATNPDFNFAEVDWARLHGWS